MLDQVIKEFDEAFESSAPEAAFFKDKRYSPVFFSEKSYHPIKESKQAEMVFVDGGNAFLIELPGRSVQLARTASVHLKGSGSFFKEKEEFYILSSEKNGRTSVRVIGRQGLVEEQTLGPEADPGKFCQNFRKTMELKKGLSMLGRGTLVLDGTLMASNDEQKNILQQLRNKASETGTKIAGLSKTTSIVNSRGSSFAASLAGKKGSWWYYPVAKIDSEFHDAELFFVKLNDSSRHVFRAEVFREQALAIPDIVAELKNNSKDLAFPGYPYGLVLADRIARVTNEEVMFFEAFLTSRCKNSENIESELNALNAHKILDRM